MINQNDSLISFILFLFKNENEKNSSIFIDTKACFETKKFAFLSNVHCKNKEEVSSQIFVNGDHETALKLYCKTTLCKYDVRDSDVNIKFFPENLVCHLFVFSSLW